MIIITDIELKNYILDRLHNKTYRELLKDNEFVVKTKIKTLGTFTYYTKKLNITMEDVYNRGISTGRIEDKLSYEDWTILTHRKNIVNKRKHRENLKNNIIQKRKEILINIGKSIGIELDYDNDEIILYNCLLPFVSEREMEKQLSQYPLGE